MIYFNRIFLFLCVYILFCHFFFIVKQLGKNLINKWQIKCPEYGQCHESCLKEITHTYISLAFYQNNTITEERYFPAVGMYIASGTNLFMYQYRRSNLLSWSTILKRQISWDRGRKERTWIYVVWKTKSQKP